MEKDYRMLIEQLYQQNKLLISAFFEIHGDNVESTSLFCLEYGISCIERDKIMLILNKYSDQHSLLDEIFWKEKLCLELPNLSKLEDYEFKKMLSLFWKDYVIEDE